MKFRKTLVAALCAATLGGLSVPMTTLAARTVIIDTAPPAPRVEVTPAPRRGYVWVPGYWDMRGHRHVWSRGHWVRERRGYHYNHPRWVQENNRWRLEHGRWER